MDHSMGYQLKFNNICDETNQSRDFNFLQSSTAPIRKCLAGNTDGFINNIDNLGSETYYYPNGGGCCMDFGFRAEPVPEPSSLLILAFGLLGFGLIERRVRA
tara:strand:+ start:905 stop:1210 length:306 start_codon:yes stop_codon:yes gene_type:complete